MNNPQISDDEIERMIAARRQPAIAMLRTAYPDQSFAPGLLVWWKTNVASGN